MLQFHYDTYNFLRHGACRINNSWLDAATDLAETSYATGGVRTTFNIGNYYGNGGASELSGTWEHYYRGIRKCNMILTRIESVPKSIDLKEDEYIKHKTYVISEARFLRAWFYWELFLRYGPIPIVTEVLDPNGDLLSNYTTRPSIPRAPHSAIARRVAGSWPSIRRRRTASVTPPVAPKITPPPEPMPKGISQDSEGSASKLMPWASIIRIS